MPRVGPGAYVQIRRGHNLAKDLAFVMQPLGYTAVDKTRNLQSSVGGTGFAPSSSLYGPTWTFTTADSSKLVYQIPLLSTSDGAGNGDFTVMVFSNPASGAGYNRQLGQRLGATQWNMDANQDRLLGATSGIFTFWTYDSAQSAVQSVNPSVDGKWHVWIGRRATKSAVVHNIWVDGVDSSTAWFGDSTIRNVYAAGQKTAIGGIADTSGAVGANCSIAIVAGWNRALADVEMRQVSADPFAMLRPHDDWIWNVAAAGGSVFDNFMGGGFGSGVAAGGFMIGGDD